MVNWKSRYAELLDQREKQQERYHRKLELLTAAFICSGQLARGVDEETDKKLRAIQGLLRQEKLKNVDLEPAVRALDKQIQRSLSVRQKSLKRITSGFRKLSAQTRSISAAAVTVQALKQFEKDVSATSRKYNEIPDYLDRLLTLHKTAVRQAKQGSGFTIWRRWFSSSDSQQNETIPDGSERVDEAAEAHQEVDDELKPVEGASHSSETSRVNIRKVLSNAFTLLLQQLGHPDDVAATERLLASRFPVDQIPDIVASVCELTADTLKNDRREFKSSLDRFNVRLKESNYCVNTCQTLNQGSSEADRELHDSMMKGFDELQSCVSDATDVEQLKSAVRNNVQSLMGVLDTHQKQSQQQDMTAALDSLSLHVQHMEDMTQAASLRLDTQNQNALLDSVTGLPNQSAYHEHAAKMLNAWQEEQLPLCIAVSNIDFYTLLLERHGNDGVDDVLKAVAGIYTKQLRSHDKVFRIGREKFVILLPDATKEQAYSILEAVREAIASEEISMQAQQLSVSVTIGIANFKGNDSIESAFTRADRACGGTQDGSRNKTVLASD